MTNPRHAAGDADATDSDEHAWEPLRWYLTLGGDLPTVYANSDDPYAPSGLPTVNAVVQPHAVQRT
jgi:hypothetical protein